MQQENYIISLHHRYIQPTEILKAMTKVYHCYFFNEKLKNGIRTVAETEES